MRPLKWLPINLLLRQFLQNQNGAMTVYFAVSMIALFGMVGLMVDYSNASRLRERLKSAADAAALAGNKIVGTADQRISAATSAFDAYKANISEGSGVKNITMTPVNIVEDGKNIALQVTVTADVSTVFGKLITINKLPLTVSAESRGGNIIPVEIAMVLDTTGSMAGDKMTTLKTAAKNLADQVSKSFANKDNAKFGIVPFGEYVNIGTTYKNASWLSVPADQEYDDPHCNDKVPDGYCPKKKIDNPCWKDGKLADCSYDWPDCPPDMTYHKQCWPSKTKLAWKGCVGSRNYPWDTKDGNYINGNKIAGVRSIVSGYASGTFNEKRTTCGSPILELSNDANSVKQYIDSLTTDGETYTASGLIWGWMMLSPGEPLVAATNAPNSEVRKFLIFMTDGENTRSSTYPLHDGWDKFGAEAITKEICQNIAADKSNKITIFSVTFGTGDAVTKKIFSDCATNTGGKFFDAANSTDFLAAFSEIGDRIGTLRLSR